MKEHFIKNPNLKKCLFCNNSLENKPWQSQWELNQHYKTHICEKCGKKNWVKVDFLGSGDDDWQPDKKED